jgi:hypothetical protein
MRRIFCDLDGVLADFDAGIRSISRRNSQITDQTIIWKLVSSHPDVFERLPLMAEANTIWSGLMKHKPIILTGCPRSKVSKESKVKWCKQYLGSKCLVVSKLSEIDDNPEYDYYIILTSTSKKPQFASLGDILIDDRTIIQAEWESSGGTFVHYNGSNADAILAYIDELTK